MVWVHTKGKSWCNNLADVDPPTEQRLTVLAGPTAVGKGTVSSDLRQRYPQVWLSVSATTRPPRSGEVDGVHYHFLTAELFAELVRQDAFLEHAVVHGRHYGTLREPVEKILSQGGHALLEIDLQGARQVRKSMPQARFVFLAPPSWEELVRRLVARGTENEEERQSRLATAKIELAAEGEFDHIIINHDVQRATDELVALIGGKLHLERGPV